MLEGNVDDRDGLILALQDENRQLERELAGLRAEFVQVRRQNGQAVSRLRAQLTPLYQALRALFGEMETIAEAPGPAVGAESSTAMPDRKRAVWESWKSKLPGKRADFIQALLDHGEMTGEQLRVATHTATGSVSGIIHELKKLGLINKIGGKYSLKEI